LNMFGSAFLTRMRGATLPAKLLEHITLMDTPGILSGQKQRSSRGYDFASVVNYIACKVDMIVLLFDTSKLDISDEYKQVIQCLKGNEEKVGFQYVIEQECEKTLAGIALLKYKYKEM
uniref:G domain-containing protein n=1 Tax=Gongylonema pulchrum TaxID=637853 RepID=A0A183D7P3_9BILA